MIEKSLKNEPKKPVDWHLVMFKASMFYLASVSTVILAPRTIDFLHSNVDSFLSGMIAKDNEIFDLQTGPKPTPETQKNEAKQVAELDSLIAGLLGPGIDRDNVLFISVKLNAESYSPSELQSAQFKELAKFGSEIKLNELEIRTAYAFRQMPLSDQAELQIINNYKTYPAGLPHIKQFDRNTLSILAVDQSKGVPAPIKILGNLLGQNSVFVAYRDYVQESNRSEVTNFLASKQIVEVIEKNNLARKKLGIAEITLSDAMHQLALATGYAAGIK